MLQGPNPEVDGVSTWRLVDLCRIVRERFGVAYGETGMGRLMHSLDTSCTDAAAALQEGGLQDGLKKALAERALNAEMNHHLGGEAGVGNSRNGYGRKTVTTDSGGGSRWRFRVTGRAASTRS